MVYSTNTGHGINTIEQYTNWAQTSVGRIFLKAQGYFKKRQRQTFF